MVPVRLTLTGPPDHQTRLPLRSGVTRDTSCCYHPLTAVPYSTSCCYHPLTAAPYSTSCCYHPLTAAPYSHMVPDHGGAGMRTAEIEAELAAIIVAADGTPEVLPPSLGALSAWNRDDWCTAHTDLANTSAANAANLQRMERALFMVCLDDGTPADTTETGRQALNGAANRFYDKTLQLVRKNSPTPLHPSPPILLILTTPSPVEHRWCGRTARRLSSASIPAQMARPPHGFATICSQDRPMASTTAHLRCRARRRQPAPRVGSSLNSTSAQPCLRLFRTRRLTSRQRLRRTTGGRSPSPRLARRRSR